ncbi:MAG: SusE domain-containing protein [Bacteroidetes Order II. Incertae sedis bacterium]|nr:SusE domain-containing protein [Bacteroidetes Order II. bacterium]
MKLIKIHVYVLALFALVGISRAQVGGSIDFDLKAGDQALRSVESNLKGGDTHNVEVHASNVTNAIAFEIKVSFDNTFFTYTAQTIGLKGTKSNQANLLTQNGGTIFNGAGLEIITTSGTKTTITLSVALNSASQTSNSVTGGGFLANIPLSINSGVATGKSGTVTLEELTILDKAFAATTINPAISGTVKVNGAPTQTSITSPANGAQVTVAGQPTDTISPTWSASTDPDGKAVSYTWQLATDAAFTTILNSATTADTKVTLTFKQVDDILAAAGVAKGGKVTVYHRANASDGVNTTLGTAATVELTRGVVNARPSAIAGLIPTNDATVVVEGAPTSTLTVSWNAATDAENDPLKYTWQLSTDPTFPLGSATYVKDAASATSFSITTGDLNALLKNTFKIAGGATATFYHRVLVNDGVNSAVASNSNKVNFKRGPVTATEGEVELPAEFAVKGNYPNPFNPSTKISFDLPGNALVGIQVYDIQGRLVMEMPKMAFQGGANQTMNVNAASLQSGTYLYRVTAELTTGKVTQMGRMTLLK